MALSDKLLEEFIILHKTNTGVELSQEEATKYANELLELIRVLVKPKNSIMSNTSSLSQNQFSKD